jgi:hypothetical protein
VDFCDLVGHPAAFQGVPVAFHAQIVSNGMDRSALVAAGCPGHGVGFDVTEADGTFAEAAEIIMGVGLPGTVDKVVEGDFIGILRISKARPVIHLTDVRNIAYRMDEDASIHQVPRSTTGVGGVGIRLTAK